MNGPFDKPTGQLLNFGPARFGKALLRVNLWTGRLSVAHQIEFHDGMGFPEYVPGQLILSKHLAESNPATAIATHDDNAGFLLWFSINVFYHRHHSQD
jgi:hypothetical protein